MSIDLDAIEARIAGRTPGDWELGYGWVYTDPIYDDDKRLTPIGQAAKFADPERQAAEWERVRHDLDLIAHAPDDLAALVAEVRATTADLAVAVEVARERGEATDDLRAGIEALRDVWRAVGLSSKEHRMSRFTYVECADALDALLREGE